MTTMLKDTQKAIRDREYQRQRREARKLAKMGAVTVQTAQPVQPVKKVTVKKAQPVKKVAQVIAPETTLTVQGAVTVQPSQPVQSVPAQSPPTPKTPVKKTLLFAEVQAKGQRKVKRLWKTDEKFRAKMLGILEAARAHRAAQLKGNGKAAASAVQPGAEASVGAFTERRVGERRSMVAADGTPFAPWAQRAVAGFKR